MTNSITAYRDRLVLQRLSCDPDQSGGHEYTYYYITFFARYQLSRELREWILGQDHISYRLNTLNILGSNGRKAGGTGIL